MAKENILEKRGIQIDHENVAFILICKILPQIRESVRLCKGFILLLNINTFAGKTTRDCI